MWTGVILIRYFRLLERVVKRGTSEEVVCIIFCKGWDLPLIRSVSPPTLHGLRATLRTWAKKRGVPDLVAEAVLAHESSDSYKGAYQRWNMLELRAQLMQAYGDHATGELVEGWEWIEPAAQAKLDAERRRTEKAERRAEEAERRAVQAERRAVREEQRGDRLEVELAEVRREVGKTNELVQRLVEQVAAGGFGLKSGESVAVKSP